MNLKTGLEHADRYSYHMPEDGLLHLACGRVLNPIVARDDRLRALASGYITYEKLLIIAGYVQRNLGINDICKRAECGKDTVLKVREALR